MASRVDPFATRVLAWFDHHGRTDLPWQQHKSPYRVWVSEIMLQQTQVTTVIPYFERFMARFPDVATLARAGIDEVLHHWTGLGYYARARNLHKAAIEIAAVHGGQFPLGMEALCELPGIGRSTAGAIASIAQGIRAPILDGNVKRVLARYHAVAGYPGETAVARELWAAAETHTPSERFAEYTQAIMDLGATVCRRNKPDCSDCPLHSDCQAYRSAATEAYPGRKPRREKPVRQARMFVIHAADGTCLLEQRPPEGLWGGLWTPPERPATTEVTSICAELTITESDISGSHHAPAFRHTFTHFHLDIEPVYIQISQPPAAVAEASHLRWFAPGGNEPLGLSVPAVKLLQSLQEFSLS